MRLQSFCFNKIGKMLDFYSQFNPSPLSIKQFLDFGEFNVELKWRNFQERFPSWRTEGKENFCVRAATHFFEEVVNFWASCTNSIKNLNGCWPSSCFVVIHFEMITKNRIDKINYVKAMSLAASALFSFHVVHHVRISMSRESKQI